MTSVRVVVLALLSALLAGCASTEMPSRAFVSPNAPSAETRSLPALNVKDVSVSVPGHLQVSEANSYLPKGDIVWRGDALGDRYAQVREIVETAMARGTASMTSGLPVTLDIEVARFHALTEKTRYSIGGVHSISFYLSIRNANTGVLLRPTNLVSADLQGYGGEQALKAERAGQTQKVRITDFLAQVIAIELTRPEGYKNGRLGIIQVLNHQAGTSP